MQSDTTATSTTTVSSAAGDFDWRSIAALNIVSTLAQVGQFGIAYLVVPLWLAQHGAGALELSLYASSLWVGQFPGLAWAPSLSRRFGARRVIAAGLLCTIVAMAALSLLWSWLWLPAGALAGFGLGLRWIGLEPWLYRIAPGHARGRLVGFHETLIGLAPIIAPALSVALGIASQAPLWLGAGFAACAAVPLAWARAPAAGSGEAGEGAGGNPSDHAWWPLPAERIFMLGVGVALFGGMTESALAGLFPLFGESRHLDAEQIAGLLTTFGVGGLVLQYAAGWLADHRGMGFASGVCSVATVILAALLLLPLPFVGLHAVVFLLGGAVTTYLTLALVASTLTRSGSMARNVSVISMVYTASAIAGPLLAGMAVAQQGGDGLVWCVGVFAALMALYVAVCGARMRDVHR